MKTKWDGDTNASKYDSLESFKVSLMKEDGFITKGNGSVIY
jgi:hypothetical protein